MTLQSVLADPGALRTALFFVAAAAAATALLIKRIRDKRSGESKVIRLSLDESDGTRAPIADLSPPVHTPGAAAASEIAPAAGPGQREHPAPVAQTALQQVSQPEASTAVATSELPETVPVESPDAFLPAAEVSAEPSTVSHTAYSFLTLQERSPVLMDIFRGALIILAIVAAGALLLVVLPQGAVDRVAAALRPRNAPGPPPEKIAFLYLGDEVKDGQFHIRGVVRNITTQPIEQLEATVRIYAPDHTLLETQVVRMDSDIFFPNATASFHLSFPDYHGQFGSYSLDFKLAQGDPVPYKDMRETPAGS